MKKTKLLSLLLSGALAAGMLAGCGGNGTPATGAPQTGAPETSAPAGEVNAHPELTVNFASEPATMDPALNSTVDGGILMNHLFEGLMRYADSGVEADGSDGTANKAELVPGQAESYEKVTNEDGTVTYTFHLRDGIKWSDGQDVTANDFVYSWQRLVDPATAADYNYMIANVVNANAIMAGEMPSSELAVSAPDEKTFVVTLDSDVPYFLEICAFPATLPVRQDVIEQYGDQWTFTEGAYISNGAYKLDHWEHNSEIVVVPSENYYGAADIGPSKITFKLMDDTNAMLSGFDSGELDFIQQMPVDEVATRLVDGQLKIVDYLGTYYVCYQTQKAPFDDPKVRQAFTLAVDRTFIVEQVTQTGQVEAGGFIPAGISDAEGAAGDTFRTVGGDFYAPTDADYEANCEKARELLAEAGYPNGEGFPVVEYLYNTDDNHKAVAEALQNMWQTELGVTVTLNNQEWATFLQTRKDGDYSIARNGWIADYNDPMCFLDMWVTGSGNNDAQYSNPEFDALIAQAKATSDPAERMSLMHQAEDVVMGQDWVLNPLYFYTQMYMMQENVQGVYYTPLGFFYFDHSTKIA